MKLFLSPFFLAFSLAMVFLPSAKVLAQQGGKIEFTCVQWGQLPFEKIFYYDGKTYQELELKGERRSDIYEMSRSQTMSLFTRELGASGDMEFKLIGQTALQSGVQRYLFLIKSATSSSAELPVQMYGMDDSLNTFPPGSFRFVNFTPVPLVVEFNGKSEPISRSGIAQVASGVSVNGGFLPCFIKLNDGRVIFESRLIAQPNGREIVFILPPGERKDRLTLKFLSQTIYPDTQTSSATVDSL